MVFGEGFWERFRHDLGPWLGGSFGDVFLWGMVGGALGGWLLVWGLGWLGQVCCLFCGGPYCVPGGFRAAYFWAVQCHPNSILRPCRALTQI